MKERVRIIKETINQMASPLPQELIGKEFDVIVKTDHGVHIDFPDPQYPQYNLFVLNDEFEWLDGEEDKPKQIRFLKNAEGCDVELPKSYIGKILEVAKVEGEIPIVYIDGRRLGFFPEEFEWVEESQHEPDMNFDKQDKVAPHESKLSLDEKDDSNYKAEDTFVESSNSLKKHGYKPIVNEVSYYEISTFDASYILHEHLESIGYDICGVWFDQESKTFRAIKKKV